MMNLKIHMIDDSLRKSTSRDRIHLRYRPHKDLRRRRHHSRHPSCPYHRPLPMNDSGVEVAWREEPQCRLEEIVNSMR